MSDGRKSIRCTATDKSFQQKRKKKKKGHMKQFCAVITKQNLTEASGYL